MNGKARRTPEYLQHMLEAIQRIKAYMADMDRPTFDTDTRTQDAIIRNPEVLGEAARNVLQYDAAYTAAHPEFPWAMAYRMRNALSHGYADIDLGTVWNTVQTDLPQLEQQLTALLGGARSTP
jgi:uncharacterized protein with HEPN domain